MSDAARDFLMDEDGDFAVGEVDFSLVRGPPAVRQSATIRLRFVKNDFFANLDAGVDYRGVIFVRPINLTAIRASFRTELLGTVGITDVIELALVEDAAERHLEMSWSATGDMGPVNGGLGVPLK